MFPYQPLDLTESDIDDFSYVYESAWGSDSVSFARHVSFSAQGLLEHLTLLIGETTVEMDIARCSGVVLETIDFSSQAPADEAMIYYYGCDDFVLPTPLPSL